MNASGMSLLLLQWVVNYEYEIWYLHRAGVQDGTARRKRRRRPDIFLPEN